MINNYDVLGIGNAIVDVLSFTSDELVAKNDLVKGSMTLVDEATSAKIYATLGTTVECSGGSVANSMAGLASLGARTAYIGKTCADQLGKIFAHDMHAVGVHFDSKPVSAPATANCLIMVTPDAQRTMATYLGACGHVGEEDIDMSLIGQAGITYIEGYLWDAEHAKAAIRKAITFAHKAGKKIAFTLSDTFCVDRHRDEFLQLLAGGVDILFANEAEIKALYQTDDLDMAISRLQWVSPIAAITRGELGSIVVTRQIIETIPTTPVAEVVDTTGAGDLYASGFLYGLSRGWELKKCAALGNKCAGEIITQLGARSQKPLAALVA